MVERAAFDILICSPRACSSSRGLGSNFGEGSARPSEILTRSLVDGAWKPTLRHLALPYNKWERFCHLEGVGSRNKVTVEMKEEDSEDEAWDLEDELEEDEHDLKEDDYDGYYSGQERYNDLVGYGQSFMLGGEEEWEDASDEDL